MSKSDPPKQVTTDESLIKDISQIVHISLGVGAAICEVCGAERREGDSLVAFLFRPAEKQTFELGHVKCPECRHEPTEYFTLGVRELVVDGRVGTCTDHATQSSWPVLLDPQPRAVSPPELTEVRPLPGVTFLRYPVSQSEHFDAAAEASPAKTLEMRPWQRAVVRADDAAHDAPQGSEPDSEREATREGGW